MTDNCKTAKLTVSIDKKRDSAGNTESEVLYDNRGGGPAAWHVVG